MGTHPSTMGHLETMVSEGEKDVARFQTTTIDESAGSVILTRSLPEDCLSVSQMPQFSRSRPSKA